MRPTTEKKIALLKKQIAEANDGDPQDLGAWKAKTEVFLREVGGASLAIDFRNIRYTPRMGSEPTRLPSLDEARRNGVRKGIGYLEAAIAQLEMQEARAEDAAPPARVQGSEIFIVHGQDEAAKQTVARYLQDLTGSQPIILHEQPDVGSTALIEKFEAVAKRAGYAVVIATADDRGRSKTDEQDNPV